MQFTRPTYLALFALVIAGCVGVRDTHDTSQAGSGLKNEAENQSQHAALKEETPPAIIHPDALLRDERPVDVVPLVSGYLAATMAEARGDKGAAAHFYAQAEQSDPENNVLKERSFMMQLAVGNMEEATRLADELVELADVPPLASILLGLVAAQEGDFDQARMRISAAQESAPNLLQFRLIQAYFDQVEGRDIHEIIAKLREFEHHPQLAPYRHYHVGRLLEKAGEVDASILEYKVASELDPSSVFSVLRLGAIYERQGDMDKAKALYKAFKTRNPDSAMLFQTTERLARGEAVGASTTSLTYDLAEVMFGFATLMATQDVGLAGYQLLNMAIMLEENYPFARFYMGILEEQAGNFDDALAIYRHIKPHETAWLVAQIRIAESMYSRGEEVEATANLEALLKKYPNVPLLYRSLAEMHYDSKNYKQAIAYYSHIINDVSEPTASHVWAYFARGAAYERLQEIDKASADLEMVVKLDPHNPMALNYLGYMWLSENMNMQKAMTYIRKALVLKPNDAAIMDSMGWALFKNGQTQSAVNFLERALEMLPDDGTINAHLGYVYEALGRVDEAKVQWARALQGELETDELKENVLNKLGY